MPTDLLLAFDPEDERLGREVEVALAGAGFTVARWSGAIEPGSARVVVLLVTRNWTHSVGLNDAIDAAAESGLRTVLAWWDEDAPSDDLSEHAAEDEVFYACFLPRPHRASALAERLRAELDRD